ncbi:hypothetical protein E4U60_000677 [Claviceps pazoutovae]|uniref:Uncharacterized protein n=1 Tax=Claviceps pazoutovae TaxID=1649127 RepID=A0A9P7ME10_9HYPO|nr:hypothetical protein E4U60_000677 [Claviceps pazoutovae]
MTATAAAAPLAATPPRMLPKATSLGTMALAQGLMTRYEGDFRSYPDALGINFPRSDQQFARPRSPPPVPTTMTHEKTAPIRACSPPSLQDMSLLSPAPAGAPWKKPSVVVSSLSPLSAFIAKSRRKTMELIDGWWDLGLLDKRQTSLGKHGSVV